MVRHGLDLATCGGLACSEVRAAAAADCAGVWPGWARRACVRRTATASTSLAFAPHTGAPQGAGRACVDAVFGWCYEAGIDDNPGREGGPLARALQQAADT